MGYNGQMAWFLTLLLGALWSTTAYGDSLETFKCPEQFGYYPDMEDCTKYFVCVFGDALHEKCTGGLYFSVQLQTCNWPRNVECANGMKPGEELPRGFETPDDEVFSSSRKSPAKRPPSVRLATTNTSGTHRPTRNRGTSTEINTIIVTTTTTSRPPAPTIPPTVKPPAASVPKSEDTHLYPKENDELQHELASNYDDPQQPDFDDAAPPYITSEGEIGIPGEPPQHLPANVGNIGVFIKPLFNVDSKEADLDLTDYSKHLEPPKQPPPEVRQPPKTDEQFPARNSHRKDPDVPISAVSHNNGHGRDPDTTPSSVVYDDSRGRDGIEAAQDYTSRRNEYPRGQFEIIVPKRVEYRDSEEQTTEGELQWSKKTSLSNGTPQEQNSQFGQPLPGVSGERELRKPLHAIDSPDSHFIDGEHSIGDDKDVAIFLKSNYSSETVHGGRVEPDPSAFREDFRPISNEPRQPPPLVQSKPHRDFVSTNNGNYKDYDADLPPVRTNNGNLRDHDILTALLDKNSRREPEVSLTPVHSNNGNRKDPDAALPTVHSNNGKRRDPDVVLAPVGTNNGNRQDPDVIRTNNGNRRDPDVVLAPVNTNNGNLHDPDVPRTNNGNRQDPDALSGSVPPRQGYEVSKQSSNREVAIPADEDTDSYDLPTLDEDFGVYTGNRQQRPPYESPRPSPGPKHEYSGTAQTSRPLAPQDEDTSRVSPKRDEYRPRDPVEVVKSDPAPKPYGEYDSPYYYDDYDAATSAPFSTSSTTTTTTQRPRPPVRTRRPTTPPTFPVVVTSPPTTTSAPPPLRTRTRPSNVVPPSATRPPKRPSTVRSPLPSRPQPVYPTPPPLTTAQRCDPRKCRIPDCRCGGTDVPEGFNSSEIPQIVLLTFDDAVNDLNHDVYNELFFTGRRNPNNCPILGTFYVSHEWTDYAQVQTLYARGHEIASHSVSHSYGEKFSKKQWMAEINGQREILHLYGGVKLEDIRGMRAPFLQIGGNKMFEMLFDANFTYDSSMPIFENSPPFWPYTLDYDMNHECMITPCPTKSFPGLWEVGMVMWVDLRGGRCSMGDACSNPGDDEGVVKMLLKNFNRHYKSNRAPFGLFFHSAWFNTQHYRRGFMKFLDEILTKDDVWLVSNWQLIQWMRNPTPSSRIHEFEPWMCNKNDRPPECHSATVCNVWHQGSVRYMRTCQQCPVRYPWVDNTGFESRG